MKARTEIVKGKRRTVIIRQASGVDRVKEAIEKVMPELEFNKPEK